MELVDQPFHYSASRLAWYVRAPLVLGGAILLGLLVTAACLTPSSDGFGTHQQLGLAPCSFIQWFGIRCPSCGMTTSWSHMVRGEVLAGLRANVGGVYLAVMAMVSGPWMLVSGVRGKWFGGPPHEMVIAALGMLAVVVTLTDWLLRNFVI